MARVNVESQALADARFSVLANLMGFEDSDIALGRMIRVWMQCIERETYVITKPVIVALFRGAPDAPKWLVDAELAEEVEGGLRVKGTQGRIEYLAEKRATARRNGTLGGRPRKPTLVSENNPHRTPKETPPAPAPAPALREEKTPLPPVLDTPDFRAAWIEWQTHRREIKKPLTPTAEKLQLAKLAALGEKRAVAALRHSIANGWQGIFEPDQKRGQRSQDQQIWDTIREGTAE